MTCDPELLKRVPLFALLDEDEMAVLAAQVESKTFAPRERIYKIGEPGQQAYVVISGKVRVFTVDEDHQEVIVDEPSEGEFFRLRVDARTNAPSNQRRRARRIRLPGNIARRHRHSAAAQTNGGHGPADDVRPSVPRLPTVRPGAREPQRERDHRTGRDAGRANCRFRRTLRRVLDFHHHFPGFR